MSHRTGRIFIILAILAPLTLLMLQGCRTSMIPNTEISDTPENREIMSLVERYRRAMEERDTETIRALVSSRYFENASSTADPTDDWGAPDLDAILGELKASVKTCTYDIKVTAVRIDGDTADVDYEYTWNFQYTDGQQDGWTRKTDVNRLSLLREGSQWKIVAGM